MEKQVQCPNCNNFRVTKKNKWGLGCAAALFALVASGYGLMGLAIGSMEVLGIALVGGVLPTIAFKVAQVKQPWVCKSCGFQWK